MDCTTFHWNWKNILFSLDKSKNNYLVGPVLALVLTWDEQPCQKLFESKRISKPSWEKSIDNQQIILNLEKFQTTGG